MLDVNMVICILYSCCANGETNIQLREQSSSGPSIPAMYTSVANGTVTRQTNNASFVISIEKEVIQATVRGNGTYIADVWEIYNSESTNEKDERRTTCVIPAATPVDWFTISPP